MRKNALVRTWRFARPYAGGLALSMFLGFAMMGIALVIPPITGAIVDDLRDVINHVPGATSRSLLPLGLIVIGAGLVEALLAYLRRVTAAKSSIAMEQSMRNELYAHLQRLQISFHDGWQSGQLLSRAMGDLSTIRRFIGFGLPFILIIGAQFAAVSVLMVRLNAGLGLVTIVLGIPLAGLSWHFDRRYHAIARRVQDNTGDLTTTVEESAVGIRIVKAFGRGDAMSERFAAGSDTVRQSNLEAVLLQARFRAILRFLPNVNLIAVVGIGGLAVVNGSLTLGGLSEFILYLFSLTWPVRVLGWLLAIGEEARTAAERFFEVMDTVPSITDRPGAYPLERSAGTLRFEGVSFSFDGSERLTLRDVNLDIAPGETVAIVGLTGSGKTALLSLVPRLHDVTEGRVTLDGHDVRDLTLSSLRSYIRVAFEEPVLFSMSVLENLLLGNPAASEADIRAALETAHATFVYDLPWGLDTRIGEQGYSLSGGQRQRLALARAVIGRPRVLVLDDPLSAVDVHTEAEIEAALATALQGVTGLLVVHRPSTLALADRVALLHDGTISAVGTHSELMQSVPMYRAILSQEADEEVAS